jgi:hypothetical protein
MKFFVRVKPDYLTDRLKNNGTKIYVYHHIIAISTPLKWFGPRLKDIIIATFDKMGLE